MAAPEVSPGLVRASTAYHELLKLVLPRNRLHTYAFNDLHCFEVVAGFGMAPLGLRASQSAAQLTSRLQVVPRLHAAAAWPLQRERRRRTLITPPARATRETGVAAPAAADAAAGGAPGARSASYAGPLEQPAPQRGGAFDYAAEWWPVAFTADLDPETPQRFMLLGQVGCCDAICRARCDVVFWALCGCDLGVCGGVCDALLGQVGEQACRYSRQARRQTTPRGSAHRIAERLLDC